MGQEEQKLLQALADGQADTASHIIERGLVNPGFVRTDRNENCLHIAAKQGMHGIMSLLIKHGTLTTETDLYGYTPLAVAIENQQRQSAATLLNNGAAGDGRQAPNGQTPLHLAVREGQFSIVRHLLTKSINIMPLDNDGNTPLHRVAHGWQGRQIALQLIKNDAALNISNNQGYTPFDCAFEQCNDKVARLFKAKDAHLGRYEHHRDEVMQWCQADSRSPTVSGKRNTPFVLNLEKITLGIRRIDIETDQDEEETNSRQKHFKPYNNGL